MGRYGFKSVECVGTCMDEVSSLTVEDVREVLIPVEVSVKNMNIREVVKMHYEAWSAREENEAFSGADLEHEQFARDELAARGWVAYPEDEWYVFGG